MTIWDILFNEMSSDDQDPDKASADMEADYSKAGAQGQQAIENFCMSICGWSYTTLREKLKEERGVK